MSSSSRSCRPKWDCSTARWCRPSKSNGFSHDAGRYSPPAGTQECEKTGMCCTTLGLCIAQSWPPPQIFLRESTWGWRSDGMLLENGAAPASLAPPHRRPPLAPRPRVPRRHQRSNFQFRPPAQVVKLPVSAAGTSGQTAASQAVKLPSRAADTSGQKAVKSGQTPGFGSSVAEPRSRRSNSGQTPAAKLRRPNTGGQTPGQTPAVNIWAKLRRSTVVPTSGGQT